MGCCLSASTSESDDDQPTQRHDLRDGTLADHAPPDSSQTAIIQPQPPLRPNTPIRPPTPLPRSPNTLPQCPPPWTRRQLEAQRAAFFDTMVTGRVELWGALRMVCEQVRAGDIAEAQGILDAVDLTCPDGRIAVGRSARGRARGGIYDEHGERYDIPDWVLTDPQDIVEDGVVEKDVDSSSADVDSASDDDASALEGARGHVPVRQHYRHKGKERAEDIGEIVSVRARLSDRATDVVVEVGMQEPVSALIERIRARAGVRRVQIMYLGHRLVESRSLKEQRWRQGHVVNAMVFDVRN